MSTMRRTIAERTAASFSTVPHFYLRREIDATALFVVHDQIAARTTLKLCLSIDHRVLDGSPAADFLGRICEFLENPDRLV